MKVLTCQEFYDRVLCGQRETATGTMIYMFEWNHVDYWDKKEREFFMPRPIDFSAWLEKKCEEENRCWFITRFDSGSKNSDLLIVEFGPKKV